MYYHLYLSAKRTNSKGLAPIYAKFTFNGLKHERSTNVWVVPHTWNNEFKRVKNNYVGSHITNNALNEFEAKISSNSLTCIAEVDELLKEQNNTKTTTPNVVKLLDELMQLIAEQVVHNEVSAGTYHNYENRCNNLLAWLKNSNKTNIQIYQLDRQLMLNYSRWLKQKNLSQSYTAKTLAFVKRLINYAHYQYNTPQTNFMLVKLSRGERKRIITISNEQLSLMERANFAVETYNKVRDLFVFQCYTGLAYVDLMSFNKDWLTENNGIAFINYSRVKTGNAGFLPLFKNAKSILLKYDYCLPKITLQTYNRYLKEVAELLNIKVNLTTHVGRKTFATRMLNSGASIETTTKMLGKTDIKDTANTYADILPMKIINELPELRQLVIF